MGSRFVNASQRMAADWSQCPIDTADSAACCERFVAHAGGSWWHFQSCVAEMAGNGLGVCGAAHAELQFPEPVPGMSGLWSRWRWCGANTPAAAAKMASPDGGMLGDSPGSACSSQLPMIATNIVDQVQVPPDLEPGDYLLSWRWDVSMLVGSWLSSSFILLPLSSPVFPPRLPPPPRTHTCPCHGNRAC